MIKKIKEFIWEKTSFTDLEGLLVFLFVGFTELAIMIFLIYILFFAV